MKIMTQLCDKFAVAYSVEEGFLGSTVAQNIVIQSPDGLRLTIDFDGKSCQPDVFVLSWHMTVASAEHNKIIRADFAASRNAFHKRKATDVCEGFFNLMLVMSLRLQSIAAGEATETQNPSDKKKGIPVGLLPRSTDS